MALYQDRKTGEQVEASIVRATASWGGSQPLWAVRQAEGGTPVYVGQAAFETQYAPSEGISAGHSPPIKEAEVGQVLSMALLPVVSLATPDSTVSVSPDASISASTEPAPVSAAPAQAQQPVAQEELVDPPPTAPDSPIGVGTTDPALPAVSPPAPASDPAAPPAPVPTGGAMLAGDATTGGFESR